MRGWQFYWAYRLGKSELNAYQASGRGGELYCKLQNERVIIEGNTILFLVVLCMCSILNDKLFYK